MIFPEVVAYYAINNATVGTKKIGDVACVCLYKGFMIVCYSPSPGAMCLVAYLESMCSKEVSVRGSTIESRSVFLEVA